MPKAIIYPGYCNKCGGSWLDKGKILECENCGEQKYKSGK